jgi:dolichyl-phosphate beta-glucosyltransferase
MNSAGTPFLSIIIPAYNEECRLGGSLEKINHYLLESSYQTELVVVDDGSSDHTFRTAQRYQTSSVVPMRLIQLPSNQGKGAAVKTGMLAADGEHLLFSDADLSTPISEVERLLEQMRAEKADIVIGSRGLPESDIIVKQSFPRQLSGKIFNLLIRLVTRMPFRDTQCGFKLFRKDIGQELFTEMTTSNFAFDVEILYRAWLKGYSILEVPVSWANSEGSRVSFLSDPIRMFLTLIKMRFSFRKEASALRKKKKSVPGL